MTLQAIEGFDWSQWDTTKYDAKNWSFTGDDVLGDHWTPSITGGRVVGKAVRFQAIGPNTESFRFQKILPSVLTQFVIGFGFRCNQYPAFGGTGAFIWRCSTNGGTDILNVKLMPDLSIQLVDSGGSQLARSAAGVVVVGAWHFLELKGVVNGASGSVNFHVDSVEVIATTTVNIGSTGIQWVGPASSSNTSGWLSSNYAGVGVLLDYDDVYVLDTSASPNNNYLGDCHVETLMPNGAGSHNDWTPDSGGVHYSRVNEISGTYPDNDTSYVQSINVGDQDSYQYDDLRIVTGTVYGVQTNLYARKIDTNLRQLYPIIVRGVTTYVGTSLFTLANGYVDGLEIFETDPSTSAQWTVTGVNAAEFGVKIQT